MHRPAIYKPWNRVSLPCRALLLTTALLAAAGCATPANRIEKNLAMFNTFPTEIQETIRSGRIGIGYTPSMVYIALGHPDRRYTRQTAGGQAEIWVYTQPSSDPHYSMGTTVVLGDGHHHVWSFAPIWAWGAPSYRNDQESKRVEFRNGKVYAIESLD